MNDDTFGEHRDAIADRLAKGRCPLCGFGPLRIDKPSYGWGGMGAGVMCSHCGLRLRAAWMPLERAIAKVDR